MDYRVENFLKIFNAHQHEQTINLGKRLLRQNIDDMYKGYICQGIASAYYERLELKKSIYYRQLSVKYLPKEHWTEALRFWGDGLFTMHSISEYGDREIAEKHFYSQHLVEHIPWLYTEGKKREYATERCEKNNNKLRVGYISQDFCNHVNMHFVIQLLGAYHRNDFEVYCYSMNNDSEDSVTEQIRELVTVWKNISNLEPYDVAKIIFADKVDILVDISVHAGNSRTLSVAAYKPAPIIISGIGYMSTSGIKAVDYFLTDVYCDPENHGDELFSEKLLRLPYTHFCYTPFEHSQMHSINENIHNPITFGSLNHYDKFSDELLYTWLNIMNRVKGSKLVLQARSNDYIKAKIRSRMAKMGFNMNLVDMRDPSYKYLDTYNDIDIALDTFPYTGGGTTFDALYMGVPVISKYGTRHGNRFGYSILNNLGLGDLAVDNWQDYEDLAVELANNHDLLSYLHKNLRSMMEKSPLMNARLYVDSVEDAYKTVWRRFIHDYAEK